jgi:soluble lytic murein transglycosylase-like protein
VSTAGPTRWNRGADLPASGDPMPALALVFALFASVSFAPAFLDAPSRSAATQTQKATPGVSRERRRAASDAAPASASRGDQRIEALTGFIAGKYRISRDATRKFIGSAYGEGARLGLDPLLIIAVIAVESSFNPVAQSDVGAMGLMQIIPHYHSDKLSATDDSVLDPHTNIKLGARVLKEYIRRGGNEVAGLQLYNGAAADASNAYANRVMAEKQRLQDALRQARDRA